MLQSCNAFHRDSLKINGEIYKGTHDLFLEWTYDILVEISRGISGEISEVVLGAIPKETLIEF